MRRSRLALSVAALGAAILAVYGIGLRAPLIYDDISLIGGNTLVTGAWPGLGAFLLHSFGLQGEYEPLTTLLHWFVYRAAGDGPAIYHLSNLALHWLNASLLFLLYRRLLASESLAFAAALLFCLYPGHTEVLAVATFKKHLLVSLFCLLILHLSLIRPRTAAVIVLCWLCQVLALLSKESALIIPWFAAVFEISLDPKVRDRRSLTLHGGLFAAGGLFILFRTFIVPRYFPPPVGGAWPGHLATSLKCLYWSLSQFPLTWSLCLEHTLSPIRSGLEAQAFGMAAGAAALLGALAALYRFDRVAAMGLAWCCLFLLPFINLLPFLNFSLVANRYLYFASAGFFLLAAKLLERGLRRFSADPKRWALIVFGPFILLYGVADIKAMSLYADPYALWTMTARCAPENPRAHTGLAVAYASNKQFDRALAEYRLALDLSPTFQIPYFGMAEVYAQTDRLPEAISIAEEQVRRFPGGGAYADLGLFYLDAGRKKEALTAFQKAAAMDPTNPGMGLNVALCLMALGKLDGAESELLDVIEVAPFQMRGQAFKLLGDVYEKRGMKRMAARLYEEALRAHPMNRDLAKKLAALYRAQGEPKKAAALLNAFLARLGRTIEQARAGGRERDREVILDAQKQFETLRLESDGPPLNTLKSR